MPMTKSKKKSPVKSVEQPSIEMSSEAQDIQTLEVCKKLYTTAPKIKGMFVVFEDGSHWWNFKGVAYKYLFLDYAKLELIANEMFIEKAAENQVERRIKEGADAYQKKYCGKKDDFDGK